LIFSILEYRKNTSFTNLDNHMLMSHGG
jgi:hypothetical protein